MIFDSGRSGNRSNVGSQFSVSTTGTTLHRNTSHNGLGLKFSRSAILERLMCNGWEEKRKKKRGLAHWLAGQLLTCMLVAPRTVSSCDRPQRESLQIAVFSYLSSGVILLRKSLWTLRSESNGFWKHTSTYSDRENVDRPELATWAIQSYITIWQPEQVNNTQEVPCVCMAEVYSETRRFMLSLALFLLTVVVIVVDYGASIASVDP